MSSGDRRFVKKKERDKYKIIETAGLFFYVLHLYILSLLFLGPLKYFSWSRPCRLFFVVISKTATTIKPHTANSGADAGGRPYLVLH